MFFFVNLIYSDCCDPSRQQKKRGHSDSEEDDSEGSEEGSDEEEDEDKTSTTSSLETKTEAKSEVKSEATPNTTPTTTTTNNPLQPGWFGKGRRKRARCWDLIFEKPPFTWLVNANCKQIMWLAGQCVGHQNTNLVTMIQKDFYNPTQFQKNNDLNIMHMDINVPTTNVGFT